MLKLDKYIGKSSSEDNENITMRDIFDRIEARAEARGVEKGRAEILGEYFEKVRAEVRAEEKAAYAAEKQGYLSEIGALRAELAKYKAAGIIV